MLIMQKLSPSCQRNVSTVGWTLRSPLYSYLEGQADLLTRILGRSRVITLWVLYTYLRSHPDPPSTSTQTVILNAQL